ncbi:uncharacterized protein BXZ73DRAFT_106793 [Epithele typhae]|uniref:uncharacterized protein n=1 Tax=Epithele typhae TaxID=378194 RepID=UPI002008970A|nr:uncharacterized protein BXZ73DRAFT_106793 [Epithele typhae]KAH9913891.1 hypothetical protein BXZ73DRAFT_106793 [Epithele typhae]
MQILSDNDHPRSQTPVTDASMSTQVVTSTPDVSSSGLPLEILERIIKDAWTDACSQDEQANLYWTLFTTSPVVAAVVARVAINFPTLYIDLDAPTAGADSELWGEAVFDYKCLTNTPRFSSPPTGPRSFPIGHNDPSIPPVLHVKLSADLGTLWDVSEIAP